MPHKTVLRLKQQYQSRSVMYSHIELQNSSFLSPAVCVLRLHLHPRIARERKFRIVGDPRCTWLLFQLIPSLSWFNRWLLPSEHLASSRSKGNPSSRSYNRRCIGDKFTVTFITFNHNFIVHSTVYALSYLVFNSIAISAKIGWRESTHETRGNTILGEISCSRFIAV